MTNIKISELITMSLVNNTDFFPIVDSGSLTTERVSISTLNNWFTTSGSCLSASYASYAPTGSQFWSANGSNISNTNVGYVGINNTKPQYQLDILGDIRGTKLHTQHLTHRRGGIIQDKGVTEILTDSLLNPYAVSGSFIIFSDVTSSALGYEFPPKAGDGIYIKSVTSLVAFTSQSANFGIFCKNPHWWDTSYVPTLNDKVDAVGLHMFGFYDSGGSGAGANDMPIWLGGARSNNDGTLPSVSIAYKNLGVNVLFPSYSLDINGTGRFVNNVIVTGSVLGNVFYSNVSSNTIGFYGTASNANSSSYAVTASYVIPAVGSTSFSYTNTLPISSQYSMSVSHGLGTTPSIVRCVIQCTTPNLGYSVGDEVDVTGISQNTPEQHPSYTFGGNSTHLFGILNTATNGSIQMYTYTSSLIQNISLTSWKLKMYAKV